MVVINGTKSINGDPGWTARWIQQLLESRYEHTITVLCHNIYQRDKLSARLADYGIFVLPSNLVIKLLNRSNND